MNLDINIGDTILTGRFKNKRVKVKEFGVDSKGQPTVNGRPILKFRIEKLMPGKEEVPDQEVVKKHVSEAIKKQINKR
tara:strand:- start:27 stop:260 length:234 start_codon:yes stop_codon:yes gene_type:complete